MVMIVDTVVVMHMGMHRGVVRGIFMVMITVTVL